jgi:hypothetical protein
MTTALWGIFLACSWTWCIGMYLPRILVGAFGWPGWVAFAAPNVLGCVLFGYAVATRERSRAMVERHGGAMLGFSLVAIAYQLFFLTYVVDAMAGPPWAAPIAALAAYGAGLALARAADRTWLALAAIVYAISLAAFAATDPGAVGRLAPRDPPGLAWVAPVMAIGFLLCPFLDLTFHRAIQRSPSRHAFAAFGVGFIPMIALTPLLWPEAWPADGRLPAPLIAHLVAQLVFTIGAHAREATAVPIPMDAARRRTLLGLPLLGAAILPAAQILSGRASAGDDAYLRLLGFYGLAFPAYVVVFVGPWRSVPVTRRALLLLGAAIVVLAPALEVGFVHRRFVWLIAIPAALALWAVSRRPQRIARYHETRSLRRRRSSDE